MAEKVIIDIELKGFGNAQKGLDNLTKAQIEQQDAIKATKEEIKDYEKELKAIRDEQEAQGEVTDEQIVRERELTQSIQDSKVELAAQKDELSAVNTERRAAVKEVDTYNSALEAEIGSNEQLRAQLKILTQEYDGLSQEQRENTEEGQQMTAQIKELSDKLKENESAVGDNRRNVGNYEEAVTNALGKVNLFGVNLGQVTNGIRSGIDAGKGLIATTIGQAEASAVSATSTAAQATATNSATAASGRFSKALNVLKFALIGTGIGAIVVALGALVGAFASTQRGADAFTRAITPIKFVAETLLGVLQDLSFILVDKVKGAFEDIKNLSIGEIFVNIGNAIKDNVLNRLEAFSVAGQAIAKILDGKLKEGFIGLGDAVVQFGTGITDASGKASNAAEVISEGLSEVAKRTEEAVKRGNAFAESQIALEKAQIFYATAIAQTNKELKEQELLAQDQTATDEERIEALQKAVVLAELRTTQQKALAEAELNLATERAKNNDTDREAKLEIANIQAKIIDLDAQEAAQKKRLFSLLTGLQKKQITANETLLKQQQQEKKLSDDRVIQLNKLIATEEQLLGLELQASIQRLGLNKAETELTATELAVKKELYNQYYQDLDELRKADAAKDLKLKEELAAKEKENREFSELELEEQLNVVATKAGEIGSEVGALLNGISNTISLNAQADINKIDDQLNRGLISQSEYEAKKEKIERRANQKRQKVQITQAIIGGAQAAVQSLANTTLPFPISLIAPAIIAAQTVAQVNAIKSQKFADGGLIQGNSHAQGGVPFSVAGRGGFEAEGGEFIHKTKAVEHYGLPFMNALNNLQLPKMFAEGGYVAPVTASSISQQVSDGVSELVSVNENRGVQVVNVEQDFSNLQNKVNNVESARTY